MSGNGRGFSETERKRFTGLLRLAAESPFAGERANALAAAERLAARHGMTLADASDAPESAMRPRHRADMAAEVDVDLAGSPIDSPHAARFVHLMDWQIQAAKARREAALAEARARGLDAAEAARRKPEQRWRPNRHRMDPLQHARVLLTETNLRLHDIVHITGLDIYTVVGLKLRLRRAA